MTTIAQLAAHYHQQPYGVQSLADMHDIDQHAELDAEQEAFLVDLLENTDASGVYRRMDGGELQTVREYLGLTLESLAGILRVNPRTVRAWEAGRDPIPDRIREEVEAVEAMTAAAVGELVTALSDSADPAVGVYRRDEDMHAARPDTAHLPARWWRMVVARACEEVPGVVVTTA